MNKFSEAPQDIREYLGSSGAAVYIDEINKKADIARTNLISDLLYEIIVKETPPNYTVERLKEKIGTSDDEKAKSIAREIKEKILQPIYYALLNWGVDINDIDTGDAPTLDEFVKKEAEFLESLGIKTEESKPTEIKEETIHPEEMDGYQSEQPIKISIGEIIKPATTPSEIRPSEDAPLILQREKEFISPTRKESSSKGFSLPFGFFKKPPSSSTFEPVKAKIEFLDATDASVEKSAPEIKQDKDKIKGLGFFNTLQQIKKGVEGEQKKVVHYSELRTPVTPFAKEEEFINLETFGIAPGAGMDYSSKDKETLIEEEGKNNDDDYDDDNIATRTMQISHEQREPNTDNINAITTISNDDSKKIETAAAVKTKMPIWKTLFSKKSGEKKKEKDKNDGKGADNDDNYDDDKEKRVGRDNDYDSDNDKNGGKKKGAESVIKTKTPIWKTLFSKKSNEKKKENAPLFPITGGKMSETPEQSEDEPEEGPKIEGNIVDLRSNS